MVTVHAVLSDNDIYTFQALSHSDAKDQVRALKELLRGSVAITLPLILNYIIVEDENREEVTL